MSDINMLRKLINEVKMEAELGILQEGVSKESLQESAESERKALKEYIARSIVDVIKECGE